MIELTTGIAFLLSSMYGAGTTGANALTADVANASTTVNVTPVVNANDRAELEKYLKDNFADTPILIEIAKCESELRHVDKNGNIIRGRVDRNDVGVMQINERYHLENAERLGYDIHTVEGNVAYAKYLYEKYGSEPWKASSPCWSKTLKTSNGAIAKK